MVKQKRAKTELKYITSVFLRTGVVVAAWFGITGLALNALGDRPSLQCDRNEESMAECKLSVKHLLTETTITTLAGELQPLTNQAVTNPYFPSLVQWQMKIATNQGAIDFNSYGIAGVNHWGNFTTRTNLFLETPQLRSFTITAEYSFWFKLLSQSISGISILCGLFIVPGLIFTAKYGDDSTAHQQAFDRLFGQFNGLKSSPENSDNITEQFRHR